MKSLSDIRPQRRNANKHTARGLGALEKSIQTDGWIGAITVAADGETFDGSARLEVGAAAGFADAVIVESDGSRPVIVKRTDIPSADDPRAKRLGIAANRVASLTLDWDPDILKDLSEEIDLAQFWREDELSKIFNDSSADSQGADQSNLLTSQYHVLIECRDESEQRKLLERCGREGLTCKALIS